MSTEAENIKKLIREIQHGIAIRAPSRGIFLLIRYTAVGLYRDHGDTDIVTKVPTIEESLVSHITNGKSAAVFLRSGDRLCRSCGPVTPKAMLPNLVCVQLTYETTSDCAVYSRTTGRCKIPLLLDFESGII